MDFETKMYTDILAGTKISEEDLAELIFGLGIETIYWESLRWQNSVSTIVPLKGKLFEIPWLQGSTENQPNEFFNQPFEVEEVKVMVTQYERVK